MKSKSSSSKEETKQTPKTAERFPRSVLLRSKALKGYQQDFVRVILTDPEYTLEEAIDLLESKLKEEA